MSDYTQAYFDYKTTNRVVLGIVIISAMIFGTCAYGWRLDNDDKKEQAAQQAAYRKQMYDEGYVQVPKPCVPSGELIWEKK